MLTVMSSFRFFHMNSFTWSHMLTICCATDAVGGTKWIGCNASPPGARFIHTQLDSAAVGEVIVE